MIDPFKILREKDKFEGLGVDASVVQDYLKVKRSALLKQGREQVDSEDENVFEEGIKSYFVASLVAPNTEERNATIRQIAFYLSSVKKKTPDKFLETCEWLDERFENIRNSVFESLKENELTIKEDLFEQLDSEPNLLKKDFEGLKKLAEEIIEKDELPKYVSAYARVSREYQAAGLFRNFILDLEKILSNNYDPSGEIQDDLSPEEQEIEAKLLEILNLAPEYGAQIRGTVKDFEKSREKKRTERDIVHFESIKKIEQRKSRDELVDYLSETDGVSESHILNEQSVLAMLNALLGKVQRFEEVLEEFKDDELIVELKMRGHAWFQSTRLKLSRIKTFYKNNYPKITPEAGQEIINRLEDLAVLFERLIEEHTPEESGIDLDLLKDGQFLKNLLNEIKKIKEIQDANIPQDDQENHDTSNNSGKTSKKSLFSRFREVFSQFNRRKI